MEIIPDRAEFKRAEVEKITSLSGNVLDYWEGEFSAFFPKNKNGAKTYLYKDVLIILQIKQYLTVERLNKAEIKEKLKENIEITNKLIEKDTEKNNSFKKKPPEEIKQKTIHPIESTPNIKNIKQRNPIQEPKEEKKKQKNNKNQLSIIKQDLHKILTILKNSDRKGN